VDSDREHFRFEASFHTAWKAGIQGCETVLVAPDARFRGHDDKESHAKPPSLAAGNYVELVSHS
jgi:hypothetical protein